MATRTSAAQTGAKGSSGPAKRPRTGWTRGLGLVLASAVALGSAPVQVARAQAGEGAGSEAEARDAFARGRAAYDAGDFEAAAQAFERAYALSGKSGLLYNLYLAFRDANRQAQAAEALRSYLAKDVDAPNRPQLEARLKALDAGLAARAEPAPQSAPAAAAAPVSAPPPAAPAAPAGQPEASAGAPYWRGPVIVAASGAAIALASAIPGVMAAQKASQLADACAGSTCAASLRSTEDARHRLAATSDVMLIGGLATAAAGTVWFFVRRHGEREVPPVTAGCGLHGCSAAYTGHF